MAAELYKLKFILGTATVLFLLLVSAIVYCTVTDAFVLERDLAFDVDHDLSAGTHYYDDEDVDHSKQPSATGSKQAPDVMVQVSTGEFCKVMWENKHLLRGVPERRAIAILCGRIRQAALESETVYATAREATRTDGQDYSDRTSDVNKLTEWCKHQEEIDNNDVRQILLGVCRDINKPDTIMPAESFRKDTTKHEMAASDATTVAAMEAATSSPAVKDVVHSMDMADMWEVMCHNVHFVNEPELIKRALSFMCQIKAYEAERTMKVTGWTPSEPQDMSLSSRESGLIKLRWLCAHPEQTERLNLLPQVLSKFCPIIDELESYAEIVTGVTSEGGITSSLAAGKATRTDRQDYSDRTTNVNKLTEWCKHQEQIDNYDVRLILLGVCRDINKPDTIMPAESFRKDTTDNVTIESNATTVATVEAATSLTAVTDVVHIMDTADMWEVMCHNVLLVNGSRLLIRTLLLLCRMKVYEVERTMNVTGWTPSVPEDLSLSSRESGLIKLRWVCTHADQAQKLILLPQFLLNFCPIVDELGATTQPPQLTESTPHDSSVR